jgi:hypothetical protein
MLLQTNILPFAWEETTKVTGWNSNHIINQCKPIKNATNQPSEYAEHRRINSIIHRIHMLDRNKDGWTSSTSTQLFWG